ncbi:MAG TPA: filamentous hemagglutinin N-terminal domain-containing protein, partial [Hyphomicrobiales bacterium]|nr:filamentous hemagglutinin N-terminal domain-containing protein [Hyphomicrobiales bacterium]
MNRAYRVVWNNSKGLWQVASEMATGRGKTRRRCSALPRNSGPCCFALTVLAASLGLMGLASSAELPTGGSVVAGSGSISQSGTTLTVTQASPQMAAHWQSFNIGQGHTVNFVQPSATAAALNRVMGADASVIQGALKANGQIFLVNPNGILFTPTAQVNVGGIVASTLNISTADFMAGNYKFQGASSNAIVNQGNITAVGNGGQGGTIAMIAAKIINEGNLAAHAGNVLLGTGSKVTLDLGGPVKIQVEEGALNALIEQGGVIKADGGLVYLTAKAAGDLAGTVINHTGVTEAQTLATGSKGQIVLLGGLDADRIAVGGTLDAGAPHGGDGGFIETSAAKVAIADHVRISTAAPQGATGQWLIDPVDFTIAASGGDITGASLSGLLNSNHVTIQT